MQPSNAMLADLRTLAAVRTNDRPLAVVEDPALQATAYAAYVLGVIDGRVAQARAVLEDLARGE